MLVNIETARTLIIERSRQLVKQLIGKRGHDKPPFLSEEFANILGITRVEKTELGNTSGILIRIPGNPIIKINQSHNKARQNFSCAHEIAHILLRELGLKLDTGNISYRTFNPQAPGRVIYTVRERLCNMAATELLMPESIFKSYLSNFGISVNSIKRLADIFGVSISATARRIAEISEEPCIALFWQMQNNKSRTLKLAWSVDPGITSTWKAGYVPVHTSIRYPSTLHKAYEQDSSVKCYKLFKRGTDVKRWSVESKGFGRGETRYVISLAFPDGRKS